MLEVRKHFAWAAAASLANLMGATVKDPGEAAIFIQYLGFAQHCTSIAKHYRLDYTAVRGMNS